MNRHQEEVRKYLSQAYLIDKRIESRVLELERLRSITVSPASPSMEMSYNPNRAHEAPFVNALEKVWDVEDRISADIERLVKLREQISAVINGIEDPGELLLIRYRYVHNYSWSEIAKLLNCSERHVYRLHEAALEKIRIPD